MLHLDFHTLAYIGLTAVGLTSSIDWLSLFPRKSGSRKSSGQKTAFKKTRLRSGRRRLALRKDRRLWAYCCATLLIMVWLSEAFAPSDGSRFEWPEMSLSSVTGFVVGALGGAAISNSITTKGCFVTRVIDGDTVELNCNGQIDRGRLLDIDTPELKGKCAREIRAAQAAKAYLAKLVDRAKVIEITEKKSRDKYGRRLIWLKIDGKDAAASLLAAGHGRRYSGDQRKGWC